MKPSDSPYLADLEVFLAVKETGTYEAAAAALGCSQSTVSRSLLRLSAWLGRVLTTDARPHELTQFGFYFANTAQQIVLLMKEAQTVEPPHAEPRPRISPKDIKL